VVDRNQHKPLHRGEQHPTQRTHSKDARYGENNYSDDAFKLTIDVLFPKWNYTSDIGKVKIIEYKVPTRTTQPEIYRVAGYADDKNLWELQCNLQPKHPSK